MTYLEAAVHASWTIKTGRPALVCCDGGDEEGEHEDVADVVEHFGCAV